MVGVPEVSSLDGLSEDLKKSHGQGPRLIFVIQQMDHNLTPNQEY